MNAQIKRSGSTEGVIAWKEGERVTTKAGTEFLTVKSREEEGTFQAETTSTSADSEPLSLVFVFADINHYFFMGSIICSVM